MLLQGELESGGLPPCEGAVNLAGENLMNPLRWWAIKNINRAWVTRTLLSSSKYTKYSKVCGLWCGRTWLACREPWPQPHPTPLGWAGTRTLSPSVSGRLLALLWLNGSKFLQPGSKIWWKAFPEEWRLLQQQISVYNFGMRCSGHHMADDVQVSTYIWLSSFECLDRLVEINLKLIKRGS